MHEADAQRFAGTAYNAGSRVNPPMALTTCSVLDDGNASPNAVRSTLYTVPSSEELLTQSKIPLCLIVSPMADPVPGVPVPLAQHGADGPIRCTRCKAYLNPATLFVDGGRRFQCNFCGHASQVPGQYFCNLDHTGRRHDLLERPELTRGTVEYAAPKAYCIRDPQPAAFVFVIDVSYTAIQSGMVATVTQAIRELLNSFPRPDGAPADTPSPCRIGIITYDRTVHFYNLASNLSQPQMMVVSDTADVFLPLKKGLLVNVHESTEVIETVLEQIPHSFASTKQTEPCFGAAMRAAMLAAQDTGGKILAFQSVIPLTEPGKLTKREDPAMLGTEREKGLFAPSTQYYVKLAKECVKHGISNEVFLFPNAYIDAASISPLATTTGGQILRYPFFRAATGRVKLVNDIRRVVTRRTGIEAMLRVRCSTGLRATDYCGPLTMENSTDVEMAGIDADKCLVVRIKHDDKIKDTSVHFQVATLYTTVCGERRIRVHTLSLNTSTQLNDVFRGADMDAVINVIPKFAAREVRKVALPLLRKRMVQQATAILGAYRKYCTSPNTAAGQLILPECLKLLPLYTNCILRNSAFRSGGDVSSDDRITRLHSLYSMRAPELSRMLYPRVLPLHDINAQGQELPKLVRPSAQRLQENGVYLVENGQICLLWIGRLAPSSWIQSVLGAANFSAIDTQTTALPALANAVSERVRGILNTVRSECTFYMPLMVIKQKDPSEVFFQHFMVEDKRNDSMSYVEFLRHVHREIQQA